MGTAEDFVLSKPLGVDGAQQAQRHHRVLAIKDVVDEPFEVVRVVAVRHHVRRVGRRHAEGMRKLVALLRERRNLLQARLVAQFFKIRMVGRDSRRV